MVIDCTTCAARDIACGDCVVSVLLGGPPDRVPAPVDVPLDAPWDLDDSERVALGSLARAGLVPPLRLIRAVPERHDAERGIA